MEKKLAEYRNKKERQEKIEKIRIQATDFINNFLKTTKSDSEKSTKTLDETPEPLLPSEELIEPKEETSWTLLNVFYHILCLVFWLTLYAIFIQLQFGTVFVIVSALFFIYFNTRTRPKRKNEISAYSVFNENCESIDGTLKAEQFERELRYGGL